MTKYEVDWSIVTYDPQYEYRRKEALASRHSRGH